MFSNIDFTKKNLKGFPGSSMVKNPTANAGDMWLIPGPGRPQKLWNDYACASQLLSMCFRACEPQLLKPMHPRACAPQQEKPPQWEAWPLKLEKIPGSNENPAQPKINK